MAEGTPANVVRAGDGFAMVPDPTTLTREALAREITALRETLDAVINGRVAVISTRLDGMDEAIKLVRGVNERVPDQIDSRVQHLKELHDERFRNVDQRFEERDVRTEQAARDTKVAVDAALAAQEKQANERSETIKDATAKSEGATTKLIDAQTARISDATTGLERQHADLKERVTRFEAGELARTTTIADIRAAAIDLRALQERLTRLESLGVGHAAERVDQRQVWGAVIGVLGVLIALASLAAVVALR